MQSVRHSYIAAAIPQALPQTKLALHCWPKVTLVMCTCHCNMDGAFCRYTKLLTHISMPRETSMLQWSQQHLQLHGDLHTTPTLKSFLSNTWSLNCNA